MLVMAKSGGGKTFMVQQFLLMAARDNPLISIIERGDSYRPLVELMGGRMITMSLDTEQTINPWDLPEGEKEPSKDQVAFLKNLTRHMLGEGGAEDTELLDNLITEAILRTYKRAAIRPSNPIPTFCDLRDELSQWRDEEKNQRVMDEAHLAAIKLRSWTGEKGVYSKLFDRPTTISLDNPWLFFNVEQLSDDPRLETAMSLLIAHATAQRASGRAGRRSITVLDECWFLLDSPVLAPEVVQLFRTARKRNASVWGISQTAEDFVGTESSPRVHGAGIVKNSTTKIVGQQPGDVSALREHLHLNETALNQIKHFSAPVKGKRADALLVIGEKADTTHTIRMVPDADRLLDRDDLRPRASLSVLVSGAAQGRVANRRLSAIGRCFSIRSRRSRPASGRVVGRGRKGSKNAMKRISNAVTSLHSAVARSKRLLAVLLVAVILAPTALRAQGVGDLLLLLHTITSTLQGPIGDALSEMRKVSAAVNNFRQQIIWPLALINQTRSFVSATRAHYTGLMSQIEGLKNNSATLALPMQLESMFRGAQSGSIGQIPSLYTQVYQPVALAGIAQPGQRNLMDIDDAMAMDSLKTSMVSDQTTQGMLTLADSLEQQAMTSAPGSASMVTAQARVADLVTQAQLAKMLAAQLRQEATKLAHQNATLKHSATTTQNLFNQIQQVLAHP